MQFLQRLSLFSFITLQIVPSAGAQRARQLGIPLDGTPGPQNRENGQKSPIFGHFSLSNAPRVRYTK